MSTACPVTLGLVASNTEVTSHHIARAIETLRNGTLFDDDPEFRERARLDALEIIERAREQASESSTLTETDRRWISSSMAAAVATVVAVRLPEAPKTEVAKEPKQQSRTPSSPVRDAKVDRDSSKSDPSPGRGIEKPNPMMEWLSPKAACAYAKCSRQTLWRWRRQGLKAGRGGRIRRSDLDAWLGGTADQHDEGGGQGELLRPSQAASRAGVCVQTIWRWTNAGLKVRRRGRFVWIRSDVLDKYLSDRS